MADEAMNQGGFGTCVSHALMTVIADQLRQRYSVAVLSQENVIRIVDAIGGKWDGANVAEAAKRFNEKAEH